MNKREREVRDHYAAQAYREGGSTWAWFKNFLSELLPGATWDGLEEYGKKQAYRYGYINKSGEPEE